MRKIFLVVACIFTLSSAMAITIPKKWQPQKKQAIPLALPTSLVAMNSQQGLKLLNDSHYKTNSLNLLEYFITQYKGAYCSVASDVMVANALGTPKPISANHLPYRLFNQQNVFSPAVLNYTTPLLVGNRGQNLDQNTKFLKHMGLTAKGTHVSPSITFTEFEAIAKKTLSTPHEYIMVNFLRTRIGEIGGGHFSPLAAYNSKTDRFLLLDVARYKYPAVWVSGKELYQAMRTIDSTNKRYRGFIIVRK
jgi:hypothetical protein